MSEILDQDIIRAEVADALTLIRLQHQQVMNTKEAAIFLRMSDSQFDRWFKENGVPYAPDRKLPSSNRKFERRDLLAALRKNKHLPTSTSAVVDEIRNSLNGLKG